MMKHLTEEKIKLYEKAMTLQMFLISELGPTRLLFKVGNDDDAQKVKISLTETLECSCSPGSKSRCIHGIFAMVKVFKIPCESELVFQERFSEAQVNWILEGRFRKVEKETKKHDFLKRKGIVKSDEASKGAKGKSQKKVVDKTDSCPICYEVLGDEEPLSPCKCCVNAFHIKCLLTWSKHQVKMEPHKPVKCPMCRSPFDDSPGETIKQLEYGIQKFQKKEYLHPGTICYGCNKKDLIGPIFTNIWHSKKIFCKVCFEVKYLNRKGECVSKMKIKDTWAPVCSDPNKTLQKFLISALPVLGQSDSNQLQIVGFDVGSTSCQACKAKPKDTQGVRRLPCDHKVCAKCLLHCWNVDQCRFTCPIDDIEIFPALQQSISPFDQNQEMKKPSRSLTMIDGPLVKSKQPDLKKTISRDKMSIPPGNSNIRQTSAGRRRGENDRPGTLIPLSIMPIGFQMIEQTPQSAPKSTNQSKTLRKPPLAPIKASDLKHTRDLFEPMLTITRPQISNKQPLGELPSINGKRSFG